MIELLLLEKRDDFNRCFGNIFDLRYPRGDDSSPEGATDLVGFLEIEIADKSRAISARISLNISDSVPADIGGIGGAERQNLIKVAQHAILLLQIHHSIKPDMNLTVLIQNLPTEFHEVLDYDVVDKQFFETVKSA